MKIEQAQWTQTYGWSSPLGGSLGASAQLVLVFGGTVEICQKNHIDEIRIAYPAANILGCSTAGEICDVRVSDNSLVVTAVHFEHSSVRGASLQLNESTNSYQAGEKLAALLPKKDLIHVFVLSDGLRVNGSSLVSGLTEHLPQEVTVTGGLSGDGDKFQSTFVLWNDQANENLVAVLGIYGTQLKVGYASLGGWDSFGMDRVITKSKGNVLYELDGQSALDLYKKYLGEHAKTLPSSGLLFPLSLRTGPQETPVVRTILTVNETEGSMTFAGDVPEGSYARLMKANFDRLIDGAVDAAKTSCMQHGTESPDLAILISCVGRKLVLKQRIEEEVEGVRSITGPKSVLTGFYSYGEISPFTSGAKCELHNQTMTITTFLES